MLRVGPSPALDTARWFQYHFLEAMPVIDALANIGLPRYLSAEELLSVMDEYEVEAAVVSATPACTDLRELSRAAVRYPDRFRVLGAPVGATPEERRENVAAQLDSGFLGIQLSTSRIAEEPDLLDQVGRAGAVVLVTGSAGLSIAARPLLNVLNSYSESLVCAPVFGGAGELASRADDPLTFDLQFHARFLFIVAGHGAFPAALAKAHAHAVIEKIGWERALWGSDFPQCLWRGESYLSTTVWIDKAGLAPSPVERAGFFSQNARRYLFERRTPAPRPLPEPWSEKSFADRDLPVGLFPNDPIDLQEGTQHTLLAAYLKRSGPGSYRDFIAEQLALAAKRLDLGDKG